MFITRIFDKKKELTVPKLFEKFIYKDIILDKGIPLNNDMLIALNILKTNSFLSIVFIDSSSSKYQPEVLLKQDCIIIFDHETNFISDINEYNPFNEILAIYNTSKFDYIDTEFHETSNDKLMNVINIKNFRATEEYYLKYIEKYTKLNKLFPSILISKSKQLKCLGKYSILRKEISNRILETNNEDFEQNSKNLLSSSSYFHESMQSLDIVLGNLKIYNTQEFKPYQLKSQIIL